MEKINTRQIGIDPKDVKGIAKALEAIITFMIESNIDKVRLITEIGFFMVDVSEDLPKVEVYKSINYIDYSTDSIAVEKEINAMREACYILKINFFDKRQEVLN
jgi:hypothetical protein